MFCRRARASLLPLTQKNKHETTKQPRKGDYAAVDIHPEYKRIWFANDYAQTPYDNDEHRVLQGGWVSVFDIIKG